MKIFRWGEYWPYSEHEINIIAENVDEARKYAFASYSLEYHRARLSLSWDGKESSTWMWVRDTEPEILEIEAGLIIEHLCEG